jgi:uncharacterized protein (TIGR03086 family)
MDDMTLLAAVLDKTADLIEGTPRAAWDKPTPCSEFTVRDLIAHMVGWAAPFEAAAQGRTPDSDPSAYEASERSAAEFRSAVDGIKAGWQANGTDRSVSLTGGGPLPGQMVVNMTLMEYLAHGWDLARATEQPMPYSEEEAQAVLDRAVTTLPEQYRGEGKPFGIIVDVPIEAPALERFAGFMGRQPSGSA